MNDYVVMFQKGWRVGTRSLRMEYVQASTEAEAVKKAKALFPTFQKEGYHLHRVKNDGEAA